MREERREKERTFNNFIILSNYYITTMFKGGVPIAAGGYGCVFDPPLRCDSRFKPYDINNISKLMVAKKAESEKREILKFAPILSTIPNAEKYFILNVSSCVPAPLSANDLKDFDRKCKNFRKEPEFKAANMRNRHTLSKLLILNMLNGGVDIDVYLTKKPLDGNKLFNVVYGIKDLINNAIVPMNKLGVYHLDLKPANIVIDRNNQMRIIDWGLSDIVKDRTQPIKLLMKPLQFNNPFYTVLARTAFFEAYAHFLKVDADPKANADKFIRKIYLYLEQTQGQGHSAYLRILLNDIYKDKPMTAAGLRDVVIAQINVMVRTYTNFNAKTFDSKGFMETLYNNIDIWGALMSFGLLFYKDIEKNIELPKEKKKEFLERMKKLLDENLFFKFDKINVDELNLELDELLHMLKPELGLEILPDIDAPAPPDSNPPLNKNVISVKKISAKKSSAKKSSAKKTKKNRKMIILTSSTGSLVTVPSLPKTKSKSKSKSKSGKNNNKIIILSNSSVNNEFVPIKMKSHKSSSAKQSSAKKPKSAKKIQIPTNSSDNNDFVPIKMKSHKSSSAKSKKSPAKTQKKVRKPRCPNGTRRNPKTGKCEPKK